MTTMTTTTKTGRRLGLWGLILPPLLLVAGLHAGCPGQTQTQITTHPDLCSGSLCGGAHPAADMSQPWNDPVPPVFVVSAAQCPNGAGGAFCNVAEGTGGAPSPCEYPNKGVCDSSVVGHCDFQFVPDGTACNGNLGTCKQHRCVRNPN